MADWGTSDSSGTTQATEQAQAETRARLLGLVSAGLGLLSYRAPWGQRASGANMIGQAGQQGLSTYLGAEQDISQGQLEQQKMAIESGRAHSEEAYQRAETASVEARTAEMRKQASPVGPEAIRRYQGTPMEKFVDPDMSYADLQELKKAYLTNSLHTMAEAPDYKAWVYPDGSKHALNKFEKPPDGSIPYTRSEGGLTRAQIEASAQRKGKVASDAVMKAGPIKPWYGVGGETPEQLTARAKKAYDDAAQEERDNLGNVNAAVGASEPASAASPAGGRTPAAPPAKSAAIKPAMKVAPDALAAGVPATGVAGVHRSPGGKVDAYMDVAGNVHHIGATAVAAAPAAAATPAPVGPPGVVGEMARIAGAAPAAAAAGAEGAVSSMAGALPTGPPAGPGDSAVARMLKMDAANAAAPPAMGAPTPTATPMPTPSPAATPGPATPTTSPAPTASPALFPPTPEPPMFVPPPTGTPAPAPSAAPTPFGGPERLKPVDETGKPLPNAEEGDLSPRKGQGHNSKTGERLFADPAGNIWSSPPPFRGPWKLVLHGRAYHRKPKDVDPGTDPLPPSGSASTESAAGIDFPVSPRIVDPAGDTGR